MTQNEADILVTQYHEGNELPVGFTTDHKTSTTDAQGIEHEVVYIMQGDATVISYEVEDDLVTDITLVKQ